MKMNRQIPRKLIMCAGLAAVLSAHALQELPPRALEIQVFQTTRQGDRLAPVMPASAADKQVPVRTLELIPSQTFQTFEGVGSSFTEAGASVLAELSEKARGKVMQAWFSTEGAHISLTRTHIASCDFSVRNYTYAPVPGDVELEHFSIEPDRTYLLPMIKAAQAVDGADFKILASPWTAPPWMKTNNAWNGGELKPEYYSVFANYIVKYIEAYGKEGVPIWGLTPVNEPLGNGANWESLHFNPEQMRAYIADSLGPALAKAGLDVPLWIYDQNREDLMLDWADTMYGDKRPRPLFAAWRCTGIRARSMSVRNSWIRCTKNTPERKSCIPRAASMRSEMMNRWVPGWRTIGTGGPRPPTGVSSGLLMI